MTPRPLDSLDSPPRPGRRLHPFGVCGCCGHVGATHADLSAADPDPLCDRCEYARRRWDAWRRHLACPGAGYPYLEPPPKSPPRGRLPAAP